MTKDFPRLPSPHPEERKLAELRAAPLIGKLILSWTELERDMNRAILNGRNIKEWKHPPDRKLNRFQDNLNEWTKLFLRSHDNEKAKELRAEIKRLQQIRNDIAHNIWMVRLDTTLGVLINIVQENWKFWEEEAQWGKAQTEQARKRSARDIPHDPVPGSVFTCVIGVVRRVIGVLDELTLSLRRLFCRRLSALLRSAWVVMPGGNGLLSPR